MESAKTSVEQFVDMERFSFITLQAPKLFHHVLDRLLLVRKTLHVAFQIADRLAGSGRIVFLEGLLGNSESSGGFFW